MFIIIGAAIVIVSLIAGFTLAGGNLLLLIQPAEFLIIGGAALGSMVISAPLSLLKKIIAAVPKAIGHKHESKKDYLELLKSFYELFLVSQRDGLLAIEKHIENPEESEVLSANKKLLKNKVAMTYFTDTLKVMLSGGVPPHEIESLMETEIETFELESKPVPHLVAKTGDASAY